MKRYKKLIIHCGSDENALPGIVMIGHKCRQKNFSCSAVNITILCDIFMETQRLLRKEINDSQEKLRKA